MYSKYLLVHLRGERAEFAETSRDGVDFHLLQEAPIVWWRRNQNNCCWGSKDPVTTETAAVTEKTHAPGVVCSI
jgi:hypothetical protein